MQVRACDAERLGRASGGGKDAFGRVREGRKKNGLTGRYGHIVGECLAVGQEHPAVTRALYGELRFQSECLRNLCEKFEANIPQKPPGLDVSYLMDIANFREEITPVDEDDYGDEGDFDTMQGSYKDLIV